jgi:hypothetical protein
VLEGSFPTHDVTPDDDELGCPRGRYTFVRCVVMDEHDSRRSWSQYNSQYSYCVAVKVM